MKKLTIILSLFFFSVFIINAQQWDSLGAGVANSYSTGPYYGEVSAQTAYKGNLYIGGQFNIAGKTEVSNVAEWNGIKWLDVDTGTNSLRTNPNPYIETMCVYDSQLYAGGSFDSMGGKPILSIARWNGITWSAVGTGMKPDSNWGIYAMCVYDGDLYAGGDFDSIGGIAANNIAKWNGTSWSPAGSGISYNPSLYDVTALYVYKNQLYAGGKFDTAGGVPASNIACWNGSTWSPVGSGINANGAVYGMTFYNDSLYVGGEFDSAGGKSINNIATWNGTNWSAVGKGIPYGTNVVLALQVYDSVLCVGGLFNTAGGIPANNIAYWNGTNWGAFGSGTSGLCASLYSFNSVLYAGGSFATAGGIPVNSIAQWTGNVLGVNNLKTDNETIRIYPNPSNGIFQLEIKNEELGMNNTVEVYNMLGEKVYSQFIVHSSSFIVDLSGQPNGVYLYRVISQNGDLIGKGKIVIQK